MLVDGVQIGAPGVYIAKPPPQRQLLGVPMDVCAFVGVAPRGPARVPYTDEELFFADISPDEVTAALDAPIVDPIRRHRRSVAVPVESWDDYVRLFGSFEGPGRLPYSVASFFEQGGRRAYVVRIVHDFGPLDPLPYRGTARGRMKGFAVDGVVRRIRFRARNEGTWGNGLTVRISFTTQQLVFEPPAAADRFTVPPKNAPPVGTLLRFWLPGGTAELRIVQDVELEHDLTTFQDHAVVTFGLALTGAPERIEVVQATVDVNDGAGRTERHEGLALGGAHPQQIATVLATDSELVWPWHAWASSDLVPTSPFLPDLVAGSFTKGRDGYADLVTEDFFDPDWFDDPTWVPGKTPNPLSGIQSVLEAEEVATLVVPDLYEPSPLPSTEGILDPAPPGSPYFTRCEPAPPSGTQEVQPPDLPGLMLDPADPTELDEIVALQQRLAGVADSTRAFVVLLDVPPGLDQRRIVHWRGNFATSYAAAYHPWLDVVRSVDGGNVKARMNPSAFAAGIMADRERKLGVPFGPSNEIAVRVVDVADAVAPVRHAELHPLGVNVFLRVRDGVQLTAARTLSDDASYRQLSVRRLMMMLVRTLRREMQWVVFEPNNRSLQADLRQLLRSYLSQLYRANAFTGATEDEAFFVRCDDSLNTQDVLDAGELIAEIGVAPAEPLEFLVVRLVHTGDGTLLVDETSR